MPELPEVEHFRQYLDSTSLHKKILDVIIRDDYVLDIEPEDLKESLNNKEFISTKRHGKYVLAELNKRSGYLIIHFGMTGNLKYYKNQNDEPDHALVLIKFDNGYTLAYDCTRKLGKISITESIEDFIIKYKLGPDALEIDIETFKEIISHRNRMIKSFFMNQNIIAGVGNLYSDEIFFQSKIHPRTKVNDLDDEKIEEIFNNMKNILKKAIDYDQEINYSEEYIMDHREEGEKCPKCGGEIEKIKVSSRSTYFCPNCQPKI
jgi:formamidopyrimidine-DNA glycosylase